MNRISEVLDYINDNAEKSNMTLIISDELLNEIENVYDFISYSTDMYDIFASTDYIPYIKSDECYKFSNEEVKNKVDALKLTYMEYKNGVIDKNVFLNSIKEDKIIDVYYYVNSFLVDYGFDIEKLFLSNIALSMISDKSGMSISELFIYSEALNIEDYMEVLDLRNTYDKLDITQKTYFDDNNRFMYNSYGNDLLYSSYEKIVDYMLSHLNNNLLKLK